MTEFVSGLTLAERFYHEVLRPALDEEFPQLPHSAALIGAGSEVLGLDTPVSADHHWGPRAMLFLGEADHAQHAEVIVEWLRRRLPHTFLGWPTNFSEPDPLDHGTQLLRETSEGPINHRVQVFTIHGWFRDYLGVDIDDSPTPADWLALPSQKLRTFVAGAVFHDGLGLGAIRERFRWYPHDVWLYMMAAGWKRVAQEEHLVGRAAQVGDELGSRLIAARLVRDLMRLCFLMEREYAPYAKWFGTAFARLDAARDLMPLFDRALRAEHGTERGNALAESYTIVARRQNALALCEPQSVDAQPFFGRSFPVIFGERFANALLARVAEPRVREIPWLIGGVDQWSDSTDLLTAAELRARLAALFEPSHARGAP